MAASDAASSVDSAPDLVVYYNDCIDTDNITAALALLRQRTAQRRLGGSRRQTLVCILEPRQVALGLGMSKKQQDDCKALIQEHFPDRGPPFKVLLGGLLKDADIESVKDKLTLAQLTVLRMAVRPAYGPTADAKLHAQLMACDFANCLSEWVGEPVYIYIDFDSLEEVQNPVNLNVHVHEELFTRSPKEFAAYQSIMSDAEPVADPATRHERLRAWYEDCLATALETTSNSRSKVDALNFDGLCQMITEAKSVSFIGGSSLRILRQFIETGIAHKIRCYLQVVSLFDLALSTIQND
jgi:hypothetical protein